MTMKIAYLHCFSGISGDMFLGALVDAGLDPKVLEKTVDSLNVGAKLEISKVDRCGITATKVDVIAGGEKDMPREVYQEQHGHDHNHHHAEEHDADGHEHHHGHEHEQDHGHHHEHGRSLKEIRHIIAHAPISPGAKQRATAIFEALGRAEAKIHNKDVETIHFHEVGSVDAIVDIVCAAVGSEALGVDRWVCSPLNVGGGTVVCAHGTFPVPAPATLELLQSRNAPVFSSGIQKELVTPTGAAIVSVLAESFGAMPAMAVKSIGYGAGYRDLKGQANVLQITVGETVASGVWASNAEVAGPNESVSVLEATIDDMTAEMFGHLVERVLDAGALDIFFVPAQMKKSRPGTLVTVLTRPEDRDRLAELMFAETTTIGIRVREDKRYALPRRQVEVETRWGKVRVKVAGSEGNGNCAPEYEDCRRIAVQNQVSLKNVMQEVVRVYLESKANHHE